MGNNSLDTVTIEAVGLSSSTHDLKLVSAGMKIEGEVEIGGSKPNVSMARLKN